MKQIVLSELFRNGFCNFRFPLPGKNDDVWKLLVIYDLEGRRARALNLRTEREDYFSAAEVVIPEEDITTSQVTEIPIEKVELTRRKYWLSKPAYKGLYVSFVLLICLVLYLMIFVMAK